MVKRLIFIHQENQAKLEKITGIGPDDLIVFFDKTTNLAKGELSLKAEENSYSKESGKVRQRYNSELIQRWAYTRYEGKPSFVEELAYENSSFWYSVEFFLTGDVGYLGNELAISGIMFYIDVFSALLKKYKPKKVIIENDYGFLEKIIRKVCEKNHVSVNIIRLPIKNSRSLFSRLQNNAMIQTYLRGRVLTRRLVGKLFCKKMKAADIIIITSDRLSYKENRTDYYWGPLVKELEKTNTPYKMIEYDRLEVFNSLRNIVSRYLPQKYDAQFIGTYYDRFQRKEREKIFRFFKKTYQRLSGAKHFQDSFCYNGINFYDLMIPKLKSIFLTYSFFIADVAALAKSIMRKENPSLIIVDHEKNYYGRELIKEARNRGKASASFEAEIVHDSSSYLMQVPVAGILDKKNVLWKPIPDRKFLWGEYSKKWYETKNCFPPEKLCVVGAPKYDVLKEFKEKDRAEMRKKYHVDANEKLVTVITASWLGEEEYLNGLFNAFRKKKGYRIVVKMHVTDPSMEMIIIKKKMSQNSISGEVIRFENTSKLVYASDLVVSCATTLAFEYVLLNKPVIMFGNYSEVNNDYDESYVKEGLISLCANQADMEKAISRYISTGKVSEMPEALRKSFIKKYLYSDDGKASERAVVILKKMRK
jgi:hypothetical protein